MLKNLRFSTYKTIGILFILLLCNLNISVSQVSYNAAGAYSLRKVTPSYNGNAIQVRRTCDDATKDIGFTICGELDTMALKKFVVASNPLSAITSSATAAYSLRKLRCAYSGSAITVRRTCDNATKDIGFTNDGDLDTIALKAFVMASNPLSAISAASAAAFSLRKLRCIYAGNAIEVRRSSDNTTLAIGFTSNGDLDTVALKVFVGANNGFIKTWYDQSGNNNNAAQTTTSNQPQIIVSGKINRQNGQPAIIFSTALNSYLSIPYVASTLNFSSASTINAVLAKTGAPSNDAAIFAQAYPGSGNISIALAWNTQVGVGKPLSLGHFPNSSWSGGALPTDVTTNTNNIITGTMQSGAANTTTISLYQNGTIAATASNKSTIGTMANQPFNIGKRWDYTDYAPMNMQELIVFKSVINTTDRNYLEWSQAQYYSISSPDLSSTLPTSVPSAFVTKWYDQSGNNKDVSQATDANQPRIINAGIIERQNAMPAIRFIKGSSTVLYANTPMVTDKISISVVAKLINSTARMALFDLAAAGGGYQDFVIESNTFSTTGNKWGLYTNNTSLDAAAATSTNLTSLSLVANNVYSSTANITTNTSYYVNGTAAALTSKSGGNVYRTSWPNGFVIGNFNGYGAYLDGYMAELIVLPTVLSNTDRQFIEWTQGQYYNINGISLSGMPSGAANAYVTTWYDQSGNARNLTQPTTGNQPKIINAGKMSLQNGRPAIVLDGTSSWLIQSTLSVTQPYSLNAIATRTANNGGYQRLVNISATGDSYGYLGVYKGDYATFNGNGISTWNDIAACTPLTSIALNSQAIMTMVSATGATGLMPAVNGTKLNLKNGTSVTGTGFLVGGAWNTNQTSQLWPGTISEFNIFSSSLSTTRINLLETNQAAYYGTTISNNKYTPPTPTSYNLYVNGVGRESGTDTVRGTRNTMGMGISVTAATTAFLKDDGDYITYGMNCISTSNTSTSNLPATIVQRWENDWYVNKTDISSNNGIMSIYFDFSDYGVSISPGVAANYVLLYRSSPSGAFSIVPNTTVTTVSDRVVFAIDGSNITTNYYYTIGTKDATISPLPIELLGFNCNVLNTKTVELTWSTASELNNDYFSVERSSDAVSYQSIGIINGSGNSVTTKHYSLVDENALVDVSYYRLKSVDLDGSYKYSSLCSVNNQSSTLNGDILIYPNPTNSFITIDFTHSVYAQPDFYSLMDITGKEIEVPSIRNNNIISIDMSSLQPGLYMLEVIKGNQKSIKKITLQK